MPGRQVNSQYMWYPEAPSSAQLGLYFKNAPSAKPGYWGPILEQ
jgi:hypothetical protein